jgi:GT2 family glycosyltransferase
VNDVIAFFPRDAHQAMHEYARSFGFDLLAGLAGKDQIIGLVEELKEKERIIRQQKTVLDRFGEELRQKREIGAVYFAFETLMRPLIPIIRPVYRVFEPKLGKLNQHAAREIRLPRRYSVRLRQRKGLPSIAIVTPSFNQGDFISRTIKSVIEQSYADVRYFVQDGASSDDSRQIIERFSKHLSGWEASPDDGQAQAINRGFANVSGDIMAWLNSDDVLLPGALDYVGNFFACNPEVDVVYGHRLLIDENDGHVGDWVLPKHDDNVLSWVDFVPQETMFWRRRIWERIGGELDESFQFAMDWDLLVRFRDAGAHFARLPRFLGGFRVHPEQKTAVAISDTGIEEMNRIRMKTLGRIPMRAEIQKAVLGYLLRHVGADVLWRMRRRLML